MNALSAVKAGSPKNERTHARNQFLKAIGVDKNDIIPLACDASMRCYYRLPHAILMDDPSENDDTKQFQRVSRLLLECGVSAPEVYEVDHSNGFMILEDWGDVTYRHALTAGIPERVLYEETVNSLIKLHKNLTKNTLDFSLYSFDHFVDKACLLTDWVNDSFTPSQREEYRHIWQRLYREQPLIPHSLALRDVMVDNLMWLESREGINRCGFIDFQDATWTPITYDLFSLLQDARRDVKNTLVSDLLERYLSRFPSLKREEFFTSYAIWGAQRTCRIIGVFHRLAKRDLKPQYLHHLPRLKRSLETCLEHPCLRELKEWFREVRI